MNNNILNSIALICNVFYRKSFHAEQGEPQYWLATVAGLLPGLLAAILCGAFVFCMGSVGGGILSAIFIPLFLELLTGWRGLEVTVRTVDRLIAGESFTQVLDAGKNPSAGMQLQILFASLYLLRMAIFGLIAASGNAVWFLYALGGAYLIRGEILTGDDVDPDAPQYGNWLVYIISCVIAGALSFHFSALASLPVAIILTILLLMGIRRILNAFSREVEFWQMELFGYLAENLLLLAGLILFGRQLNG